MLTILIAGPWFQPGFIFGTDFAGPRHYAFPDSPTSYAALQVALGVAAIALPADIVGKLNGAINASLKSPPIQASLAKFNVEPNITTPQEFGAFIAAETAKWGGIIRATGIKAE